VLLHGNQFPREYHRDAFAAQHGSWNRARRTGYKLVRVPMKDNRPTGEYEDFLTGFVTPDGDVWGRPVGVTVGRDGSLFVSDDGSGTIWRVRYGGNATGRPDPPTRDNARPPAGVAAMRPRRHFRKERT
jgi:glucose/arabinose dehydrogenase